MTVRFTRYANPIAARGRSPAFSMAEVLFAIIILGLGLILIAAAFPIGALQSTKAQDATVAAMLGRLAYDQMTNVPATDTTPDQSTEWEDLDLTYGGTDPVPFNRQVDRYCKRRVEQGDTTYPTPGKPMTMGFLDGTQTITISATGVQPRPDLRVKLVYPMPCYWEPVKLPNPTWPVNPTWADDGFQDQDDDADPNRALLGLGTARMLGIAAYQYSTDPRGTPGIPVPWLVPWGFKEYGYEFDFWYEHVRFVSQTDRRYYWYAFYRQMYEADFVHPLYFDPLKVEHTNLLTWFQADLITRRTYRVLIMACKAPPEFTIEFDNSANPATPLPVRLTLKQIEPPLYFEEFIYYDSNGNKRYKYVLPGYTAQWTQPNPQYFSPVAPNIGKNVAPILGPVRVPENDVQIPTLAGTDLTFDAMATRTWLSGTYINNLVHAKIARTGGIVIDAWANIYQIVDVITDTSKTPAASAIRLDKPLKTLPAAGLNNPIQYGWSTAAAGDIRDALPLWFNPQAISVFPTIMTKQAEKP